MHFYSSISLAGYGFRIRIRIQPGNLNLDPPGSGSATLHTTILFKWRAPPTCRWNPSASWYLPLAEIWTESSHSNVFSSMGLRYFFIWWIGSGSNLDFVEIQPDSLIIELFLSWNSKRINITKRPWQNEKTSHCLHLAPARQCRILTRALPPNQTFRRPRMEAKIP